MSKKRNTKKSSKKNKQSTELQSFVNAKKRLCQFFGCEECLYIKNLEGFNWSITDSGDFHLLSYYEDEDDVSTAVVILKSSQPFVVRKDEITLVVAIECVRTGFVFSTNLEE